MSNQNTEITCGACTVAIGAHTCDNNCKLGPYEQSEQYRAAQFTFLVNQAHVNKATAKKLLEAGDTVSAQHFSGLSIRCFDQARDFDLTSEQYELALVNNRFTRDGAITSSHVRTQDSVGNWFNINESAIRDMFDCRRRVLAELIAIRDWEDNRPCGDL